MSTLIEKIEKARANTASLIKENPAITDIWYDFKDCTMEELREAAKEYSLELEYSKELKRMQLHVSTSETTIFCYSETMEVTEHFVESDVVENV